MTTILTIGALLIAFWFIKDYLGLTSPPKMEPAIVCNGDGSVRFRMNSPTLSKWRDLVIVGAKVRAITMKRETPKVQIHVRGKYFVFLSGDGLLCTESNVQAYWLFNEQDEWVITEVDGQHITMNPS